jgi:hypothetical protein
VDRSGQWPVPLTGPNVGSEQVLLGGPAESAGSTVGLSAAWPSVIRTENPLSRRREYFSALVEGVLHESPKPGRRDGLRYYVPLGKTLAPFLPKLARFRSMRIAYRIELMRDVRSKHCQASW